MYSNPANGSVKFLLAFGLSILLRILPIRPWNVEPILAMTMPFGPYYGPVVCFLFAAGNMALYDIIVGKIGGWTFFTAITYGLVAVGACYWFQFLKKFKLKPIWMYASYAVIGTLVFDLVTFSTGPLFLGQYWGEAIVGQIPFTMNHLLGNILLSITLSPLLDYYLIRQPKLEADALFASWAIRADE